MTALRSDSDLANFMSLRKKPVILTSSVTSVQYWTNLEANE